MFFFLNTFIFRSKFENADKFTNFEKKISSTALKKIIFKITVIKN